MKKLITLTLCLLAAVAHAQLNLASNNIVQFSFPIINTVYSNANDIQIFFSTNGGLNVQAGTTNITGTYKTLDMGTNTVNTVTNFPLGIQFSYHDQTTNGFVFTTYSPFKGSLNFTVIPKRN